MNSDRQWISVKVSLPKNYERVLVGYKGGTGIGVLMKKPIWSDADNPENQFYDQWFILTETGTKEVEPPIAWMSLPLLFKTISNCEKNLQKGIPPIRSNVVGYMHETCETILELLERVENCDRQSLNSEFEIEIGAASGALQFLQECLSCNLQ